MKIIGGILLTLFTAMALADTPPPNTVKAKVYSGDGATAVTTTGTSLNVNVTNPSGSSTVNQGDAGTESWLVNVTNTPAVTQSGTWTTGRTWALSDLTDSVSVSNFPSSLSVTQGTSPWVTTAAQSGTWNITNISGTVSLPIGASTSALQTSGNTLLSTINATLGSPFQAGGSIGNTIFASTQSGAWTTGRTWSLSSGSDSVSAAISNFPATQSVTQGTSPWVVSGTVTANQGGTWTTGRTWNLSSGSDSVAATQSGSWTVTANAGTNLNTSALALDTSVNGLLLSQGSTTSTQKGTLTQGAVTTSSPSYVTAQTSPLSLTTAGALRTDATATTQPISVASLPLPAGAATSALQITGNTALSTINTTIGSPFQAGGSIGNTTFASTQSGSWTVTANAGTNLNTSALALDTTVAAVQLSQGSTSSGQKGSLSMGTVTTASPTYTTAQTSPLSLTTLGALRTDSSATTQPISAAALPLPTGAATSGNQTTANASLASIDSKLTSPLSVAQSGTWNINNVSGTISLPTGAALAANQTNASQKTQIVDGSGNVVGPLVTLGSTNYLPTIEEATTVVLVRNDYTSTNVTTAAYTQLVASTSDVINHMYIFDSSGQTLFLAVGAAASEVNKYYITPGGNGLVTLTIPSGSRVSVKAVSATASVGELNITFLK